MSEKDYKGLSEKEIQAEIENQKKGALQYNVDNAAIEKALTEYMEQRDPIIWEGKVIALVRRPTMKQLKELVPVEMRQYADNPQEAPEPVTQKYEKFFYEKMAEMIVVPKRTPEEWENTTNPWFIRKFWTHIAEIAQLMEGEIEGF